MMIDCRVMGHSVRLGIPLRFLIFCSVTQEAQAVLPSSRFSLSSAFRLAHPARDRRQAVFTGVSVMIKNVSRTDDNPYGHLLLRTAKTQFLLWRRQRWDRQTAFKGDGEFCTAHASASCCYEYCTRGCPCLIIASLSNEAIQGAIRIL